MDSINETKTAVSPVLIHRMTDCDGRRFVTVILKQSGRGEAIAKFEVLREFDPRSTYPEYEEIGFRSFHIKDKKVVEEPPSGADC